MQDWFIYIYIPLFFCYIFIPIFEVLSVSKEIKHMRSACEQERDVKTEPAIQGGRCGSTNPQYMAFPRDSRLGCAGRGERGRAVCRKWGLNAFETGSPRWWWQGMRTFPGKWGRMRKGWTHDLGVPWESTHQEGNSSGGWAGGSLSIGAVLLQGWVRHQTASAYTTIVCSRELWSLRHTSERSVLPSSSQEDNGCSWLKTHTQDLVFHHRVRAEMLCLP